MKSGPNVKRDGMERKAVIYPESKLIGCPLLQAGYGGDASVPSQFFSTEQWAVFPPEEKPMKVRGTEEQWQKLSELWKKG